VINWRSKEKGGIRETWVLLFSPHIYASQKYQNVTRNVALTQRLKALKNKASRSIQNGSFGHKMSQK
jgi:hypothetical protein